MEFLRKFKKKKKPRNPDQHIINSLELQLLINQLDDRLKMLEHTVARLPMLRRMFEQLKATPVQSLNSKDRKEFMKRLRAFYNVLIHLEEEEHDEVHYLLEEIDMLIAALKEDSRVIRREYQQHRREIEKFRDYADKHIIPELNAHAINSGLFGREKKKRVA